MKDWKEEFDNEFVNDEDKNVNTFWESDVERLKSFIEELLETQKSTLRKEIEDLKRMSANSREHHIKESGWNNALDEVINLPTIRSTEV